MRKIDHYKYLLETEDDYQRARLNFIDEIVADSNIARSDISDASEPPINIPCVAIFESQSTDTGAYVDAVYVDRDDLRPKPRNYLNYRLTRLLWPALKEANIGFTCGSLPADKADISFYYFEGKPFGISVYTDEEYSTVRFYKADSALLRNNEKLVDASPEAFIQSIFDSSIKVKEDFFSHSDQEVLNAFFKLAEIPLQKD